MYNYKQNCPFQQHCKTINVFVAKIVKKSAEGICCAPQKSANSCHPGSNRIQLEAAENDQI